MKKIILLISIVSLLFLNGVVIAAPNIPTNLTPCYGSQSTSPVTLNWSNTGASYYIINISKDGTTLAPIVPMTNSVSFTAQEGVYMWNVQACDSSDSCSNQSISCTFNVYVPEVTCTSPTPHFASGCDLLLAYDINGNGLIDSNEFTSANNDYNSLSITRQEHTFVLSASSMTIQNKCSGCGSSNPSENNNNVGSGIINPLKWDTWTDLIGAINKFIFVLAVAVAPVMFVIGGFMIVTAGGNPNQVTKAKNLMIYTAIGLAIVLLAQAIIGVLKSVIGVEESSYLPLIFSFLN